MVPHRNPAAYVPPRSKYVHRIPHRCHTFTSSSSACAVGECVSRSNCIDGDEVCEYDCAICGLEWGGKLWEFTMEVICAGCGVFICGSYVGAECCVATTYFGGGYPESSGAEGYFKVVGYICFGDGEKKI